MKVIIKDNEADAEIKYPCLRIGYSGSIVMFLNESSGIVLHDCAGYGFGHVSTDWAMDCFKPFTGTVELSND